MRTDLESLARRQPALMLGGALILGLLGARFLKSSQRSKQFRGGSQGYGREQRSGNGGFNQFSEDAEFRQIPSTGRGGYQGGGYAGA